MDSRTFGKFIADTRRAKGMTQEELAEKLIVTNKAVSRWETGTGFPDISLLEPLADALGISIIELMHSEKMDIDDDVNKKASQAVSDAISIADFKSEQKKFIVAVILLSVLASVVIALGFYFPSAPTVWTLPFLFCSVSGSGTLIHGLRKHSRRLPCALWLTVSGILLTISVVQLALFLGIFFTALKII